MGQARSTSKHDKDTGTGLGVLMLAALPMILWLFEGTAFSIALAVLMFGLLALAVRLILRGLEIERAYNAARVARRPVLPRKIIGSVLIGIVVLILAGQQFGGIALPAAFSVTSSVLSLLSFGVDPLKDKGLDDPQEMARIRHEAMRSEIETTFAEIQLRIDGLGDADLSRRTAYATDNVLCLVKAVGQDQTDMEKLSKPLAKFTQILTSEVLRLEDAWDGERYIFARRRYVAKLTVLLQSFEEIAWKGGVRAGKDAFDMEADLLLARMGDTHAA